MRARCIHTCERLRNGSLGLEIVALLHSYWRRRRLLGLNFTYISTNILKSMS